MINFTDTVVMDGEPRMTSDGYMVASARAARTGVQAYMRSELGLDGQGTINVYRPAEEVFRQDSLATYAAKPITINHPAQPVDASNWKDVGKGAVGTDVMRDGEFVRVPLVMMDAAAIASTKTTHCQISMGYSANIVMQDGVAPDGTAYQAVQKDIKINHLAFVPDARGGPQLRIGDGASAWGVAPISDNQPTNKGARLMTDNLQKVMFDGISIDVTPQAAQAIAKLQGLLSDAATAMTKATADHAAAISTKDAALAKKDAEIDAMKAKVIDGAALDKKVADRAALVGVAAKIAPDVKVAGLTDADIRKAVVTAKLGDAAVKDKPEAYIDARFDILAEDAGRMTDAYAGAVAGLQPAVADAAVKTAYEQMVADMKSGAVSGQAK